MLFNRLAVNAAFFINGFIYANWVSRLPRIQEQYNADNGTIGLVLLASSIGAVGAMPFTGWIIIKNGSRKITIVAALLYSAIIPLIPFMHHAVALMGLFFCMGIVTGIFDVAMNAQAVMVERKYNKPIMTSFHAYFSIGMALGAWCGAFFTDLQFDLFRHLSIVSAGCLVATVWLSINLIQDKPDRTVKAEGPLFRMPSGALVSVGVIAFCCMLAEGSMADWSVNYMENIVGAAESIAPIALSAFATAMTLGRIFGDKIRAAYGDRILIISGGIMSTCGLGIVIAFPSTYVVISGCFLVGLGLATIVPITYSIAGNTKKLPSGVGLAMVTTVGYTGFLMGPPVIGFISDWQDLRIGLLVVTVLLAVMTYLGIKHKPER